MSAEGFDKNDSTVTASYQHVRCVMAMNIVRMALVQVTVFTIHEHCFITKGNIHVQIPMIVQFRSRYRGT